MAARHMSNPVANPDTGCTARRAHAKTSRTLARNPNHKGTTDKNNSARDSVGWQRASNKKPNASPTAEWT